MNKPELKLKDLLADDSDYRISLAKLTGQAIADVHGYLSDEFGGASFKLTHVVLANGTTIDVEGEHDFPYLAGLDESANLDEETLQALMDQEDE